MSTAAASTNSTNNNKQYQLQHENQVRDAVKDYYAGLTSNQDLKTSACCVAEALPGPFRKYVAKMPDEVITKFYGCGCPVPLEITPGMHVLDLGSGSGRDAYLCAALVNKTGYVTGIDMTQEQLDVAVTNLPAWMHTLGYDKPNCTFVKGYIEDLHAAGITNESMDIVISNCVINLSTDKLAVLKGVYQVLKFGGEMIFSDIYSDRRLSEDARLHSVLVGECLGGALYIQDFIRLCHKVGFIDVREVTRHEVQVEDQALLELVGKTKFYSITYRLFKLHHLETLCEDYGQVAIYKGTLPHFPFAYKLDDHHEFETGKPALVCGNTASMLSETWLAPHFQVIGDRSKHFGLFPCGPAPVSAPAASSSASCSGGACC